jgi:pimeloyl-ACP methyl ester carboxylesterase
VPRLSVPHAEALALERDGAALRGLLVPAGDDRGVVVLYFGGNAFHVDTDLPAVLPHVSACGASMAVFDHRGYGRSSGTPTIASLQADALAEFDQLNTRYPGRVVVHGQSLGSFIAARVAQERPVKAMVLETTATTALGWAEAATPWYARPFVRYRVTPAVAAIDNVRAAARVRAPALVIAGSDDRITPQALGRAVYDALPGTDKHYLLVEGAGHNNTLAQGEAAYCAFLRAQR